MVTLETAQISSVGGWGSSSVITEAPIASERTGTSKPKIESYDDPKKNYGFLVVVTIGREENVFHPGDSIVKPLRDKGFDPKNLPTEANKAIQIEHDGIRFRFHKRANPVIDLHKAEPHKALANEILDTLIRTIDQISTGGSYEFDLLQPVILNFSKTDDVDGRNTEFKITYPGIGGKTIHEIRTNFGDAEFNARCKIEDSLLEAWLSNSSEEISKSLFA